MRRFRLLLAYDGTRYCGWQGQKSGRAVQSTVECALARIFPENPQLTGSSRTDAGVHALGMVAHFDLPRVAMTMPVSRLALAINACLPDDIRVLRATRARHDFHARFDARGKQYRYHIWNHAAANPLDRHRQWHVPATLDLPAMRRAAQLLLGRRSFRAFTANRGDILENPVRTLRRCDISRKGPVLTFVIEGDGFLYKMCRGIVGTLIQVGQGKIDAASIPEILESEDRRKAGMNAPAHGLTLWKVFYR
jgi:tRNA pseudouridine38-40 synthase